MSNEQQVQERIIRDAGAADGANRAPAGPALNTSNAGLSHPPAGAANLQAMILVLAPVVMMAGFLYHPHIGDPVDPDFLARLGAAVSADTLRWAVAHLLVAVGSGFILLAFLAIRSRLREADEQRWSSFGLPFIVMGSMFYALLPAMEFAPLAAENSGADPAAAQAALLPWFAPILFTGAFIFAIGAVSFAIGIVRSRMLSPAVTRLVAVSLIVMAVSRLVPLSAIQFYVQGVAGLAALWPLAYSVWKRTAPSLTH